MRSHGRVNITTLALLLIVGESAASSRLLDVVIDGQAKLALSS